MQLDIPPLTTPTVVRIGRGPRPALCSLTDLLLRGVQFFRLLLFIVAAITLVACVQTSDRSGDGPDATNGPKSDPSIGEILLLPGSAERYTQYIEYFPPEHITPALDALKERAVNAIPSDESTHTVIFVIRKGFIPGAKITTYVQFQRGGRMLGPWYFEYRAPAFLVAGAPFIIANEASAGGRGGFLHFRAETMGEVLLQKKVPIH